MRPGAAHVTPDPDFLRRRFVASVNAGLGAAALVAATRIRQSFAKNGKFRPSAPGSPPNRHNSTLYNAIASTKGENLVATVYTSDVEYARVQEFGGTITPKSKKYLTVPLNEAAARDREKTKTLRSLALNLVKTRNGKLMLTQAVNQRGYKGAKKVAGTPMYLLVRSVTLPPRPYMRPQFTNPDTLRQMIAAFVRASRKALAEGLA